MPYSFTKMHGLGNDFVVFDARLSPFKLDAVEARFIADRRRGVGCDQVIVLEPSDRCDVFMRIRNPDGSQAEACGNAARCVAAQLMDETGSERVTIETVGGLLEALDAGDGLYSVDMGPAHLGWEDIPLNEEMDTLHLDLAVGPAGAAVLSDPVAVSMGNPHVIFFVDDVQAIDLSTVGPIIEHHTLFPERTNVSIVQVRSQRVIRMRVWERSVGITQACGSAACAAVVAAVRRKFISQNSEVETILDGGSLSVTWREDGHVVMTGPAATSFTGKLDYRLYALQME